MRRRTWVALAVGWALLVGLRTGATELVVEIVTPDTTTFSATTAAAEVLRAVAYLVGEEGTAEVEAEFDWTFGDGTTGTDISYTAHRWGEAGQFPVTVSAHWQTLQSSAQATASVTAATGPTTTAVYGKVPDSFADWYNELYSPDFPILARRVQDGLLVWSTRTFVAHVIPGVPHEFDEGDVVYWFGPGDLPAGTYELMPLGALYGGGRSCNGYGVTVKAGATPAEAGMVRRDVFDPAFFPRDAGTVSGVAYDGSPYMPDDDLLTPIAAGILVQSDGFSIAGCQTTTGEDGTFTLTKAIYNPFGVTAQASDRATVVGFDPCIGDAVNRFFMEQYGTPSYGRVVGTVAQNATGGRTVSASRAHGYGGLTLPSTETEYSMICTVGDSLVWAAGCSDVTSNPYGQFCSPLPPQLVTVPAMGSASASFTWGGSYGIVWGRLTDTSGVPQANGIVRFWADGPPESREGLVRTDEEGYYVIHLVPASYQARGEAWGEYYAPQMFSSTVNCTVGEQGTQRLDFVVDPEIPVYWPW